MKKKTKVEAKVPEETPKESPAGRQELYFFPDFMRTIRAGSIEEAREKIKEGQK
jgi:hypothetical protein